MRIKVQRYDLVTGVSPVYPKSAPLHDVLGIGPLRCVGRGEVALVEEAYLVFLEEADHGVHETPIVEEDQVVSFPVPVKSVFSEYLLNVVFQVEIARTRGVDTLAAK